MKMPKRKAVLPAAERTLKKQILWLENERRKVSWKLARHDGDGGDEDEEYEEMVTTMTKLRVKIAALNTQLACLQAGSSDVEPESWNAVFDVVDPAL